MFGSGVRSVRRDGGRSVTEVLVVVTEVRPVTDVLVVVDVAGLLLVDTVWSYGTGSPKPDVHDVVSHVHTQGP